MAIQNNGTIRKQLIKMGNSPDDCWEWNGATHYITGYGKKQWFGKTELAHRWVYQIFNGPIPDNKVIDHTCKNKNCVNPLHLDVVEQIENCRRGDGTVLNVRQVKEIKKAKKHKKWGDGAKLAKKYGVSGALIHDIWNGRAWKEV